MYGGYYYDCFYSVKQTLAGDYVVCGNTYSGIDDKELYVVRIDNEGNVLWEFTYSENMKFDWSPSGDMLCNMNYWIEQTTDGGFIVAGEYLGGYSNEILIIKLDAAGNQEWQNLYGTNGYNASCVKQTNDGGYVVLGTCPAFNHSGLLRSDVILIKLDSLGNQQWQKTYGGDDYDNGSEIIELNGNFFIAGSSESAELDGEYSGAYWDYYIIKTDSNGEAEWQFKYGRDEHDYAYGIDATDDGGFILTGSSDCEDWFREKILLIRGNSDGTIAWEKRYD